MSGSPSPVPQVITLGCRLNLSESEHLRSIASAEDNLVIVNSCAVTNEAVRQTRQAIRRARRANPDARLIVTGCAAETERAALAAMDEIDGFVPNDRKLDPRSWNVPIGPEPSLGAHTRSFIGIQNGCDHSCTFCIIPQGRGHSRSLGIDAVLHAIEIDLKAGAKEVVLTGVDVTSWGHDLPGNPMLGALVLAILDRFPDLARLRMSSLDGVEIDPLLLELFESEQRVMPHLHLSLQHGHDLILKRMKRRHLRHDATALAARLKAARPEIAIGADLIAGFPTETADHHRANRSIIEELEIVHGHIFPYSPRRGTPAARMPQIERQLVRERAAELRALVGRMRSAWLERQIGKTLPVLVEADGTGHAPNFARVAAPSQAQRGSIVEVTPSRIENGLLI